MSQCKEIFSNLLTLPRVIRQIVSPFRVASSYADYTHSYSSLSNSCKCPSVPCPKHDRSLWLPSHPSAWLGWFPILFYTTLYIGELHKRASPTPSPTDLSAITQLDAEATRLGSRALLFNALLALMANMVLPYFVKEAAGNGGQSRARRGMMGSGRRMGGWLDMERFRVHLASLWAASHLVFALCMGATL